MHHTPPFDVVDSFLNVGSGVRDFEDARRNELLRRVFEPMIWEEREAHAKQHSPYGNNPGWRLVSFLVKADDELRREQLATQFAQLATDGAAMRRHFNVSLRFRGSSERWLLARPKPTEIGGFQKGRCPLFLR